jgi:hypothetical protein
MAAHMGACGRWARMGWANGPKSDHIGPRRPWTHKWGVQAQSGWWNEHWSLIRLDQPCRHKQIRRRLTWIYAAFVSNQYAYTLLPPTSSRMVLKCLLMVIGVLALVKTVTLIGSAHITTYCISQDLNPHPIHTHRAPWNQYQIQRERSIFTSAK